MTTAKPLWPAELDITAADAPFGTVVTIDGQEWRRGDAQWVPSPVTVHIDPYARGL